VTVAVVPVKKLDAAKGRLSARLGQHDQFAHGFHRQRRVRDEYVRQ